MSFWMLLALFVCICGTQCVYSIQVETVYGTVEGRTIELIDEWHAGISVNTFYSIPFAKPPLGDLRFAVSGALLTDKQPCSISLVPANKTTTLFL